MTYSFTDRNSVKVLEVESLSNELDNRALLAEVETQLKLGPEKFVLNLSGLNFINSVGLSFMISVRSKSENAGIKFVVAHASQQVINLLEITKLKTFFNLRPSVDEAIASF